MNLNKCQIIGRVTKDPELKTLPSGSAVTNFSLATNRTYKDKDGEKKEEVEFINCVVFGKAAETIAQYVRKGSLLYVEGRIQTRSWEGTDGKKNYRTEIVVENFQFGPKSANTERPAEVADPIEAPQEDVNVDDIPF